MASSSSLNGLARPARPCYVVRCKHLARTATPVSPIFRRKRRTTATAARLTAGGVRFATPYVSWRNKTPGTASFSSFHDYNPHVFAGNWGHSEAVRKPCYDGKAATPLKTVASMPSTTRVMVFDEDLNVLVSPGSPTEVFRENIFSGGQLDDAREGEEHAHVQLGAYLGRDQQNQE